MHSNKAHLHFNQIKGLAENDLKKFLNNVIPTFSENIVLSPRLWNRWTPFSRREFEKIIMGEIGKFNKLFRGEFWTNNGILYPSEFQDGFVTIPDKNIYPRTNDIETVYLKNVISKLVQHCRG